MSATLGQLVSANELDLDKFGIKSKLFRQGILQGLILIQHGAEQQSAVAAMPTPIPFFPPSQPDETLNSRVSRYHLIAGNSAPGVTLEELFGNPLTGLDQVVPPSIDVLAGRLPGDTRTNLRTVLTENTLLPLFQPFIGKINLQTTQQGLISRLPRRVVGKHGEAFLCTQCIQEDEKNYGMGYWHRAHQAPGVSACWKHRSQLLSSCPICRLPFQRKHRLLDATWSTCPQCSNNLFEAQSGHQCSDNAYRFATSPCVRIVVASSDLSTS